MLELEDLTIVGPDVAHHTTCNTAVLGPGLTVDGPTEGALWVEAGHHIVIRDGFAVEGGAELRLTTGPALLP